MAPLLHQTVAKKRSLLNAPLIVPPTETSQKLVELLSESETRSKKRKPSHSIPPKQSNDTLQSHHAWSKWSQKAAIGASAPFSFGGSIKGLDGLGKERSDVAKTQTLKSKKSKLLKAGTASGVSSSSRIEKENTENKECSSIAPKSQSTTLLRTHLPNQESKLIQNPKQASNTLGGAAKMNLALSARASTSKPKQVNAIRNRYMGLIHDPSRSEITPQIVDAPAVSNQASKVDATEKPNNAVPPSDEMSDFFNLVNNVVNNFSVSSMSEPQASGRNKASASMEIPRPSSSAENNEDPSKAKSNDNFVRLNLKNGAGSCRGARNKKALRKAAVIRRQRFERDKAQKMEKRTAPGIEKTVVSQSRTGVDPLDDLLDGTWQTSAKKSKASQLQATPCCSGHQQPCKLITVKKNTRGNKGRKFYACSFPRGEQCDHFEWADDTQEAVKAALKNNDSTSGFIARQVTGYVNQIRSLTVPELRDLTEKHNLRKTGKKAELLARLAIWARDEIAKGTETWKERKSSNGKTDDNPCADDEPRLVQKAVEREEESPDEMCSEIITETDDDHDDDDDDDSFSSEDELELVDSPNVVSESFSENDSEATKLTTNEGCCRLISSLQSIFGFTSFREGQEWAVRRCLEQKRSCFVAATGHGKSLCYTLPAALMDGVCIVVSPLVSLMQDQLRLLPPRIPAATLSGSLSSSSVAATVDDILRGRIKIVFVSPERLTSPSFRRLFLPTWNSEENCLDRRFPTVSLLCVDEAHCMSQWAHNFRPSYMRLATMIEIIQPKSVLAMTATAGPRVVDDICRTLGIVQSPEEKELSSKAVQVMSSDRDNIDVKSIFLSSQEERLSKLVDILSPVLNPESRKSTLHGALAHGSVIVYVWRQRDAEAVAENIVAAGVEGGVVFYHGGMNSEARSRSQSKFMRGKARICVATIAFGLGINKSDVAGVIHMYLSASPEHYVQEIGRAGRDGRPAKAIALVLNDEVCVRNSLAHSDLISRTQVLGLLKTLQSLVLSATSKLSQPRGTLNVAIPLQDTVLSNDVKSETIETIFSLLEGREKCRLLYVHGVSYDKAVISPNQSTLSDLCEKEPVIRSIRSCATCIELPVVGAGMAPEVTADSTSMTVDKNFAGSSFGTYAFSVSNCSNLIGENAEPRHAYAALRRLENSGEIKYALDTSPRGRALGITVTKEGLEIFTATEATLLEELATEIFNKVATTIFANANKVLDMDFIFREVSGTETLAEFDQSKNSKSPSLERFQTLVGQYFCATDSSSLFPAGGSSHGTTYFLGIPSAKTLQENSEAAYRFLKQMETSRGESRNVKLGDPAAKDYTLLAITKFLHGIPSASYGQDTSSLRGHHLFGHLQQTHFSQLLNSLRPFF